MGQSQRDTQLAVAAAKLIIDDRDINEDHGSILVTLEGAVSLILLAAMGNDHSKAAAMLNEGLVPGVEERIALAASRRKNG